MKAAVVRTTGEGFVTEEVDIDAPVGREVLVDVKASGLCHTDLTYSQHDIGYPTPSILGHEVAGVVSAVGPDVTEFELGDHVVACLVQYCGTCEHCLTGRIFQCEHPEATLRDPAAEPRLKLHDHEHTAVSQGFGLGGFAEQSLIHESQLARVPKELPFPQAALLGCGVVTGAGAVLNTANVQAGDSVVIIGAGGVGLNAISGAKVAGATRIIAVDVADDKLEKARSFGATHTINSTQVDSVATVRELTGIGADAVFDFVGLPIVAKQGFEMLAVGGGLYLVGIIDPEAILELKNLDVIGSQKRIQGVVMGSTTPKRDIPLYADLYLQGKFNLDDLVSKEISLDEVNEGYAALKDSSITRVVITSF
jgi:S-(hydroxymethyl)glutathione dehydrogenase/alcohol dehydrogenase